MRPLAPSRVLALLAPCLGLAPGCGTARPGLDALLLRTDGPPRTSPADAGLAYEDVRFPSADGVALAAWYVPSAGGPARATFLIHTGLNGNLDTFLPFVARAAPGGFNVFVYAWQGFGNSEGTRNLDHFEPDTRGAVDYLLARPDVTDGIIQVGASFGAVSALAATTQSEARTVGLVLYGASFIDRLPGDWLTSQLSPLLLPVGSLADCLWAGSIPGFFDARRYLDAIHVPVLAITAADDTTVPPAAQAAFFDALPEPKRRYLTYGGHVHAIDTDPGLTRAVIDWARALADAPPGP
jgi:alpha-beta hydrolase superfamily lysophospholipase